VTRLPGWLGATTEPRLDEANEAVLYSSSRWRTLGKRSKERFRFNARPRCETRENRAPKWRNRQTRYVQGVVGIRPWEFKSPLRHHQPAVHLGEQPNLTTE